MDGISFSAQQARAVEPDVGNGEHKDFFDRNLATARDIEPAGIVRVQIGCGAISV
jgi:hypothetical protein